jgi:hypothetical protein
MSDDLYKCPTDMSEEECMREWKEIKAREQGLILESIKHTKDLLKDLELLATMNNDLSDPDLPEDRYEDINEDWNKLQEFISSSLDVIIENLTELFEWGQQGEDDEEGTFSIDDVEYMPEQLHKENKQTIHVPVFVKRLKEAIAEKDVDKAMECFAEMRLEIESKVDLGNSYSLLDYITPAELSWLREEGLARKLKD